MTHPKLAKITLAINAIGLKTIQILTLQTYSNRQSETKW
jgi:hypothetical protein